MKFEENLTAKDNNSQHTRKPKRGYIYLIKLPLIFILHIDSKFYWLFFNFTKQHLRSAISYNYHWTLQSEFSFLLCQVINMKKWKYWAGFSCWLWVFFYRNNLTIIEVDGVIVWKLSGELMGGLWWKILINW